MTLIIIIQQKVKIPNKDLKVAEKFSKNPKFLMDINHFWWMISMNTLIMKIKLILNFK
jgi:hypothetical protein